MKRRIPIWRPLSDADVQKVHNASLSVLATTGVKILHEGVMGRLADIGCDVDRESKRVKIPEHVIEEQLLKATKRFTLAGRNKKYDLTLETDSVFTRPLGGVENIVDFKTDKWRKLILADIIDWAMVTDALEHIDYAMVIFADDVPLYTRDVRMMEVMMENTEKHIQIQPYNAMNIQAMAKMASVIQGGDDLLRKRPLISILACCLSPLVYGEDDVSMMEMCGRYGIPVMLCTSPSAGGTAPITILGAAVLMNSENLATNTILQALHPGTSVIYQVRPFILDMRTSAPSFGPIEVGMIQAICVQVARECYDFITDIYGPVTDVKTVNAQGMMEKTYNTLIPALAGANLIAAAGLLEFAMSTSLVQLIMDNELLGMVSRILRGTEVDEDRLATEVINAVGPGGHFLDTDHTYKYFREEYYNSDLCDRALRNEDGVTQDMVQNAKEKAKKILRENKPVPLDESVLKEIRHICQKLEQEKSI